MHALHAKESPACEEAAIIDGECFNCGWHAPQTANCETRRVHEQREADAVMDAREMNTCSTVGVKPQLS